MGMELGSGMVLDFVDDVELGSVMLDFGLGDGIRSVEIGVAYAAEADDLDETLAVVTFAVDGEELDAVSFGHTPNHDWHFASQ
jgi:hypothetical protein